MKKLILSIFAVAMVLSLAACGNKHKAKEIGEKKCECSKLYKKYRKSGSSKSERAYEKCQYELRALQAELSLAVFDELWKARQEDEDIPDEISDLNDIVDEAYDNACEDFDEDD